MTDRLERAVSLDRQRALIRQNQDLARRLADHEHAAMRAEIRSGDAFKVPRLGASARLPAALPGGPLPANLAPLSVPLARIAAHRDPESLPCVGVLMEDAGPGSIHALLGLAGELNAGAFARVLFLTRCLSFIPFLSRYGFACQGVGEARIEDIGNRLGPRFGIEQIRDLRSGRVLWRR